MARRLAAAWLAVCANLSASTTARVGGSHGADGELERAPEIEEGEDAAGVLDEVIDGIRVQLFEVGDEKSKVLVMDDVLPARELDALVSWALDEITPELDGRLRVVSQKSGAPPPKGSYKLSREGQVVWKEPSLAHPGLITDLGGGVGEPAWIEAVVPRVRAIVNRTLGVGLATDRTAWDSAPKLVAMCQHPQSVHHGNRCPHNHRYYYGELASTHFLSANAHMTGGTAFYRHRRTGLETPIPQDDLFVYGCVGAWNQDGTIDPKKCTNQDWCLDKQNGGALSDSNSEFEHLFTVKPRANRMVFYDVFQLYTPYLTPDVMESLSCAPGNKNPRLTVNTVWEVCIDVAQAPRPVPLLRAARPLLAALSDALCKRYRIHYASRLGQ